MSAEKLKISIPIIVEGRYDKIKLDSIVDGTVLVTDGFGIFNGDEKRALIRRLAEPRGVIVLTDSDGAGALIRSHLTSLLPKDKVIHLYAPCVAGKESRKAAPSKAGLLGVEGIDADRLRALLAPYADGADAPVRGGITKADLYAAGLSGTDGAAEARRALCARLELPEMTAPALLAALNVLYAREEFLEICKEKRENGHVE